MLIAGSLLILGCEDAKNERRSELGFYNEWDKDSYETNVDNLKTSIMQQKVDFYRDGIPIAGQEEACRHVNFSNECIDLLAD